MISVFALPGFVSAFAMIGAALTAPGYVALTIASPVPYPTAGAAVLLLPLQDIAGKEDR